MSFVICTLVILVGCTRGRLDPGEDETDKRGLVSRDKIGLLHLVDGTWFFQEMAEVSRRNKMRYARRWGYDFISHTMESTQGLLREAASCDDPAVVRMGPGEKQSGPCYVSADQNSTVMAGRAPTFGKLRLIKEACVGRDDFWLLWADADVLIVNQSIPLTSVVDDAYDLMLTQDWFMINAGVFLIRCSPWALDLVKRTYEDRSFDKAIALDQSALQHFLAKDENREKHLKMIPKHAINVYTEEYRPGDFILHMAGKLYEATVPGATALIRQFDLLSQVDDLDHVASFFNTRVLLGPLSGQCLVKKGEPNGCDQNDPRRRFLDEPLIRMSTPNRYRHAAYRTTLKDNIWRDPHDVKGWEVRKNPRKPVEPIYTE